MNRLFRQLGAALGLMFVFAIALPASAGPAAQSAAASLPRLAVMDFELEGDLGDESFAATHTERLRSESSTLREALAQSGLYAVADNSAAGELIERLAASQSLHHCNGCELDIAHALHANVILLPWVFRMSNLVLTMHVEIRDATTGRVTMKRDLDFRGDNDESWQRAIGYLLRDMKEHHNDNRAN
jgi:hypothetical protein